MANETTRPLKVFLCHASGDKPAVRDLYKRLIAEGVDAWLDQEKLLPGQDWRVEIPRAVSESDVVVICLSNKSITKEGYVQKEIRFALDSAEEKPEGTIFLIPARLEDCVVPGRLDRWQWVDLFEENGFLRLLRSLKLRADKVGASIEPSLFRDEGKAPQNKPHLVIAKPIWMGIIGLTAIGLAIAGVILWGRGNEQTPPSPTATSSGELIAIPTTTTVPTRTNTPRPSTSVPPTIVVEPTVYDDFINLAYDGRFNPALWGRSGSDGTIVQENGLLTLELNQQRGDIGLNLSQPYKPTDPIFVESKMMLDPTSRKAAAIYVAFGTSDGGFHCGIFVNTEVEQEVTCWSEDFGIVQSSYISRIVSGTWHVLRVELFPNTMTFTYVVDGEKVGSYIPQNPDKLKDLSYYLAVHINSGTDTDPRVTGYVDYVKTGEN